MDEDIVIGGLIAIGAILLIIGICAGFTFLTMFLLGSLVNLKIAIWITIVLLILTISIRNK